MNLFFPLARLPMSKFFSRFSARKSRNERRRGLAIASLEDRIAPVVGDFVWRDNNANGVQDAGEPGVAGVYVRLMVNGNEWASSSTNASGAYAFSTAGTPAGADYRIQIRVPDE